MVIGRQTLLPTKQIPNQTISAPSLASRRQRWGLRIFGTLIYPLSKMAQLD